MEAWLWKQTGNGRSGCRTWRLIYLKRGASHFLRNFGFFPRNLTTKSRFSLFLVKNCLKLPKKNRKGDPVVFSTFASCLHWLYYLMIEYGRFTTFFATRRNHSSFRRIHVEKNYSRVILLNWKAPAKNKGNDEKSSVQNLDNKIHGADVNHGRQVHLQ